MANTDIELHDDGDGWVKVAAGDLNVDGGTARRKGSPTQYKRALVHDFNDGLTVNWGNDYSGGVTINGVKTITAHSPGPPIPLPRMTIDATKIGSLNLNAAAVTFTCGAIQLNCQPEQAAAVKITGDAQFEGKILFRRKSQPGAVAVVPGQPPPPPAPPLNLADVIFELQQKVAALEKNVQNP